MLNVMLERSLGILLKGGGGFHYIEKKIFNLLNSGVMPRVIFFNISWLLILALLLAGGEKGHAQDIHFTQFYHSPLTLNPSFTGQVDGKYRVAANYRHQWAAIRPAGTNIPFVTYAASYDRPLPFSFSESDQLGIGIQFFNDEAGKAGLRNRSIFLSSAYAFKGERHTVSLGVQAGMVDKKIDLSKLTFGTELRQRYLGDGGGKGGASTPVSKDKITYFDLRVGSYWEMEVREALKINAGISLFHLTQPKESFTGQGGNRLNMRLAVHGGAEYKINERMDLLPGLLVGNQSKAQEINWGSLITYQLTEEEHNFKGDLFGGLWFRTSALNPIFDATMPVVGIQKGPVKVAVSYDINISPLRHASAYRGGLEVGVIYIPQPFVPELKEKEVPCIRL